ncbi:UNVERIFIED_CONTAM: hypothetical protein FKN15_052725 [Acipenser sinensis]
MDTQGLCRQSFTAVLFSIHEKKSFENLLKITHNPIRRPYHVTQKHHFHSGAYMPLGSGSGSASPLGSGSGSASPLGSGSGSASPLGSGSGSASPLGSGSGSASPLGSGSGSASPLGSGCGAALACSHAWINRSSSVGSRSVGSRS